MQVMKIEVGQWELEEAQAWDLLSDEADGLHKPILAWSSCSFQVVTTSSTCNYPLNLLQPSTSTASQLPRGRFYL